MSTYFLNAEFNCAQNIVDEVTFFVARYINEVIKDISIENLS
jgi:hypothetical protein